MDGDFENLKFVGQFILITRIKIKRKNQTLLIKIDLASPPYCLLNKPFVAFLINHNYIWMDFQSS